MAEEEYSGEPMNFVGYEEAGTISEETWEKLSMKENPKFASGSKKVPLELIPPVAAAHMAMALRDGAIVKKYGPFNWREKGIDTMTYVGAIKRHIDCYLDGENQASDSGVNHLGHIMACCAILLDAEANGKLADNRPIDGQGSMVLSLLNMVMEKEMADADKTDQG
jgi:hypothetical protein